MLIVKSNIPAGISQELREYHSDPFRNPKPKFKFNANAIMVDLQEHYLLLSLVEETGAFYIEAFFLTDKSVDEEYQSIIRQARALRKNGHIDITALADYDYEISCEYDGDFDSFQVIDISPIQDSYSKNITEMAMETEEKIWEI